MKKINIAEKFSLFDDLWTPKIIAQSNDQLVKLAKGDGKLVWHSHQHEDELFLVIKGQLTIQLRQNDSELAPVILNSGDMVVIPRGIEHCPMATTDTHFLMIEPATTEHTGTRQTEATVTLEEQTWI